MTLVQVPGGKRGWLGFGGGRWLRDGMTVLAGRDPCRMGPPDPLAAAGHDAGVADTEATIRIGRKRGAGEAIKQRDI